MIDGFHEGGGWNVRAVRRGFMLAVMQQARKEKAQMKAHRKATRIDAAYAASIEYRSDSAYVSQQDRKHARRVRHAEYAVRVLGLSGQQAADILQAVA